MFHQDQDIQEISYLVLSWIKTRLKQEIENWFQDKIRNYQDQDFLIISQEISKNFLNFRFLIFYYFNILLFDFSFKKFWIS